MHEPFSFMQEHPSLAAVPDDELLERLSALLRKSCRTEADLVAHIGEVDRRRLYARAAAPSMFAYCTESCIFRKRRPTCGSWRRVRPASTRSCSRCSATAGST
jgi:hypothetical protein